MHAHSVRVNDMQHRKLDIIVNLENHLEDCVHQLAYVFENVTPARSVTPTSCIRDETGNQQDPGLSSTVPTPPRYEGNGVGYHLVTDFAVA